jgi:hypothetical protein
MKNIKQNITLDRPATYQIKVPGHINKISADWGSAMTITVESDVNGLPVSTLTGTFDQAALQGLLRRLYSLGIPLLSVNLVEGD